MIFGYCFLLSVYALFYCLGFCLQSKVKGNLMIDQYDRECRRLSDELEAEHRVLGGEGEIVESFFLHWRTGLIDLKRSPMIKTR